jgi:hypothetical protein
VEVSNIPKMKIQSKSHIAENRLRMIFLILFLFIYFCFISGVLSITPFGANYTQSSSERAQEDLPQSIPAQAGNVTEINIFGYSVTQSWQGYYGNISGSIMLSDANDNVMYNWSLASPEGEIYASRNDSLNWGAIQCFNFTANGGYADDSSQRGNTSRYGMNLSQLETLYNLSSDDVDGVDETFNLFGAATHDLFYTNSLRFDEGECRSTRIYGDLGNGQNNEFEEVLLYEPFARSVVFTSLLEQNLGGFDNRTHDFEMMVLEDGHGADTSPVSYYFYVELQ